jgi:hypothetical protein
MARTSILTDDLDGSQGATERKFSIGGTDYEIDLTDQNYSQFLKELDKYRSRARVAKKKRDNQAPVIDPGDRPKIRAWAIANGRYVASRGRFPNDIVRDYYATMAREKLDLVLA